MINLAEHSVLYFILNQLIDKPHRFNSLIGNWERAWWDFPVQFTFSREDLTNGILLGIENDLVEVYSCDGSSDLFANFGAIPYSDVVESSELLSSAVVFLTEAGLKSWETTFRPNWELFWRVDSQEDLPDWTLSLCLFAGSPTRLAILEANFAWYYWLDDEFGLRQAESCAYSGAYRIQVSDWKILPVGIVGCFTCRKPKRFDTMYSAEYLSRRKVAVSELRRLK